MNAIELKYSDHEGFNIVFVYVNITSSSSKLCKKEFHPHWLVQISVQEEPHHHQEAHRQKDRDQEGQQVTAVTQDGQQLAGEEDPSQEPRAQN